ncbi:hypothetical protein TNCV_4675971 [Trichonephila clavipes]|nr:hypothetical protein TNCV_4675971 [Trichonephila clavipes]
MLMVHSGAPDLYTRSKSPIVTLGGIALSSFMPFFKFKLRKVLDCGSKIRQGRRDDRGSLRVTCPTNHRASFRLSLRNKTGREEMRSEGRRGILPIGLAARLPLEERAAQWVERGGSEKF